VDEKAKANGFEVLRLSPYFCIFNPIELIWGDLKRSIRKYNDRPESSPAVVDLIRREVQKITPEKWRNCVEHVSFQTTPPERMVINVTNSSDSDSE
jgi:transposase